MSRYIGNNFNGVLFLLREPNSNGEKVSSDDNAWIFDVLNFEQVKNANKYRKSFRSMLEFLHLSEEVLPNCAFDNIKPDGGNSTISDEYKKLSCSEIADYAFSIIDEINPNYIFTCLDIYEATKRYLIKNKISYCESDDGINYRRGNKNKIKFKYTNGEIQIFQIYHPCLGWNILR